LPGLLYFASQSIPIEGKSMHIHQALADVRQIQAVLAKTERFRLLRATTVAATVLLAVVGASLQVLCIGNAGDSPFAYAVYWSVIAGAGAGCAVMATAWRYWVRPTSWDRGLWFEASRGFVPSLVVGGLLTAVIAVRYPEMTVALPGVWSLLFGLGVWSAARLFPRAMAGVAAYYFSVGTVALILTEKWPYSSLWMAVAFGGGQLIMCGVLAYDERQQSSEG
jgi:hypothetical protein